MIYDIYPKPYFNEYEKALLKALNIILEIESLELVEEFYPMIMGF